MDVRTFIQDQIRAVGPSLLPAVRPLAVPNDFEDELVPAGSVVLVTYKDHFYLVSAAHVVELYNDRMYYVGSRTAWLEVPGAWHVNMTNNREADNIDIAFKRVSATFATQLDGCRFLGTDEFAVNETVVLSPPHRSKYVAIGYPLNAFEMKRYSRTTKPSNIAYAGSIASLQAHQDVKLSPAVNLVIDYEWDHVVGPKGVGRSPKLEGISGGGLFRIPALEGTDKAEDPKLAAICIEERRRERVLVGTRLEVLLRAMDKELDAAPAT